MRNRNTVEFLGIWETLHNPNFNPLEFEGFRKEAGLNAFTLSPTRWIEATNAIGIVLQAGRYGGTFAQTDIAFFKKNSNLPHKSNEYGKRQIRQQLISGFAILNCKVLSFSSARRKELKEASTLPKPPCLCLRSLRGF